MDQQMQKQPFTKIIRQLIKLHGYTLREFAPLVGKSQAALCTQLNSGYISAEEMRFMASKLGYTVQLIKDDGKPDRVPPYGHRAKKTVSGVLYDTDEAEAFCKAYSVPFIHQLFKTAEGDYFIVVYEDRSREESQPRAIIPMTEDEAQQFKEHCERMEAFYR